MPKNITYLLGAGASAHCLPVINELVSRMRGMISQFQTSVTSPPGHPISIKPELSKDASALIEDLQWLMSETKKHQTIDTLAKKYYILPHKRKDLVRLKKILTIYFLYEQSFHNGAIRSGEPKEIPDKRYDSFIAAIIDNKIGSYQLPPNLKIITWNYDLQFELSYKEYRSDLNIAQVQKQLQILPAKFMIDDSYDIELTRFALIHLNGVAGIGKTTELSPALGPTFLDTIDMSHPLDSLVEYYSSFEKDLPDDPITHPEINFFNYSWEVNEEFKNHIYPYARKTRSLAAEIMKDTDILVVIGYSFPFFNKAVDRQLFDATTKLTKVYIQDQKAEDIKNQLMNSFEVLKQSKITMDHPWNVQIEIQTGVNQFLIPYEFEA